MKLSGAEKEQWFRELKQDCPNTPEFVIREAIDTYEVSPLWFKEFERRHRKQKKEGTLPPAVMTPPPPGAKDGVIECVTIKLPEESEGLKEITVKTSKVDLKEDDQVHTSIEPTGSGTAGLQGGSLRKIKTEPSNLQNLTKLD